MLAVHAEEIAGEDVLEYEGHGDGHEDVAAAVPVLQVVVHFRAVEHAVLEQGLVGFVADLAG